MAFDVMKGWGKARSLRATLFIATAAAAIAVEPGALRAQPGGGGAGTFFELRDLPGVRLGASTFGRVQPLAEAAVRPAQPRSEVTSPAIRPGTALARPTAGSLDYGTFAVALKGSTSFGHVTRGQAELELLSPLRQDWANRVRVDQSAVVLSSSVERTSAASPSATEASLAAGNPSNGNNGNSGTNGNAGGNGQGNEGNGNSPPQ